MHLLHNPDWLPQRQALARAAPAVLIGMALAWVTSAAWATTVWPALTLATLAVLAAGLLRVWHPAGAAWPWQDPAAPAAPDGALQGLRALDERMLDKLGQAVDLSEGAALTMIERVTGLRGLSGRLMDYLRQAQQQSVAMQREIERNGSIVAELAGFVQQLPQQIEQERLYLDQLVTEVRQLAAITETIRGMARQTEILSINAAIAAARAGDAGRGFSVLAGEVRRLALESNQSAQAIEAHIRHLVATVQARGGGEFAQRMQHNEAEAARLLSLTGKLDEGYLDMRQFYAMLLTAITEHNGALDEGITGLLDTAQHQDVFKQMIDRLGLAFAQREAVLAELMARLRQGHQDTAELDAQASALADQYDLAEAAHRDPDAAAGAAPGEPMARIELF